MNGIFIYHFLFRSFSLFFGNLLWKQGKKASAYCVCSFISLLFITSWLWKLTETKIAETKIAMMWCSIMTHYRTPPSDLSPQASLFVTQRSLYHVDAHMNLIITHDSFEDQNLACKILYEEQMHYLIFTYSPLPRHDRCAAGQSKVYWTL